MFLLILPKRTTSLFIYDSKENGPQVFSEDLGNNIYVRKRKNTPTDKLLTVTNLLTLISQDGYPKPLGLHTRNLILCRNKIYDTSSS